MSRFSPRPGCLSPEATSPRPGRASPGSATLGWNLELSARQALLRRGCSADGAGCAWLARITMDLEQRHSGSLEALSMQVIDG